jgi:hypothetical protein
MSPVNLQMLLFVPSISCPYFETHQGANADEINPSERSSVLLSSTVPSDWPIDQPCLFVYTAWLGETFESVFIQEAPFENCDVMFS